jgi:predicted helicase
MALFTDFVASLDADPAKRGRQFELFVKWFLQTDPQWATQVDQVWLWEDYPERWGIDCGIDLVFRHRNGEAWAVQAKCYAHHYDITKHDVDKFLSESNRKGIDKRLLIATTDRIGANAKQVCDAQEKTVVRYLFSNFESANVEYPATIAELHAAKRKTLPKPREHQTEAIIAVSRKLQDVDRGQLIMACGTGKTFTTLWIKEQLFSKSTLVLVPSLGLLAQTLQEWALAATQPFDVLCVFR